MCGCCSAQVSGHISSEEGVKVLALSGAWNSHLDMAPCGPDGDPLPGAQTTRLWQARLRLAFAVHLSRCIDQTGIHGTGYSSGFPML